MEIINYIVITVSGAYTLMILSFLMGWLKLKPFKKDSAIPQTQVSVIIPARNEEQNISAVIENIIAQDYPTDQYEIIIIDDHSTDATYSIVQKYAEAHSTIFTHQLSGKYVGKKSAIKEAIKHAKGSLIVTTDADCEVGSRWLSTIVEFYETYQPKFIIAPVLMHNENTFFQKMQSLEFFSLIASGAGAAGINRPIMCNGANLAYEKEAFLDYADALNQNYASGDDVLFMLKIKKENKKDIRFLKSYDAAVFTKAQTSLKTFIQQRKRWTSKSRGYNDFDTLSMAFGVFITNLLLLILFIGLFINHDLSRPFAFLFMTKTAVDFLFLGITSAFFKKQNLLKLFLPLQLVYFFYVSFMAIYGNIGSFKWKGRLLK